MDKLKTWWNTNVDKKQFTTIVVATAFLGGAAYVAKKAGYGKVATAVKGG